MDGCDDLVEDINSVLNIEANSGKGTQMEIEESPGSSFCSLKVSLVDIFIDKNEDTGAKIFHSFEIYDNSHPVGIDLMKEIATYARSSLDITKPMVLHGLWF